jgi:hypothetical protein
VNRSYDVRNVLWLAGLAEAKYSTFCHRFQTFRILCIGSRSRRIKACFAVSYGSASVFRLRVF